MTSAEKAIRETLKLQRNRQCIKLNAHAQSDRPVKSELRLLVAENRKKRPLCVPRAALPVFG
eukprot:CAMPEP_0183442302 /NCGR_PEP_ID=MMETSP0370-20130417/87808_1 /TAXON_ID=268820 /ORGANISM="Peridinium aciculiferum, Strain PAER-2" /LENGTH=61 /DNA_ID=CAMNT_0025631883 /DNA_START=105 /DNA_END=286 /DNA_ORIENTATION=-